MNKVFVERSKVTIRNLTLMCLQAKAEDAEDTEAEVPATEVVPAATTTTREAVIRTETEKGATRIRSRMATGRIITDGTTTAAVTRAKDRTTGHRTIAARMAAATEETTAAVPHVELRAADAARHRVTSKRGSSTE